MPSITHLILGSFLAISLFYISNGKFTKTHAFILILNNYFGPDIGWLIGLGYYTHRLVSWFFFSMALALFYYYITKFTFESDKLKKFEIIDLEKHKLSYFQTFCLVLAGGILHIYLDDTINYEGIYHLIPQIPMVYDGLEMNLHDFTSLCLEGVIEMNAIISLIIGLIFILGYVFVFTWFLKYTSRKNMGVVLIFIASFIAFFILAGASSTGDHGDAGAIAYVSLYWITPIMLCTLSTKSYLIIKSEEKSIREFKLFQKDRGKKVLNIISIWLLIIGAIGVTLGIIGIIFIDVLESFLVSAYGILFWMYDVRLIVIIVGGVLLALSIIDFICVIGLQFKNTKIWKFTIYFHLIISWTIIGLVIACALSENSIKNLFKSRE